MPFSPQETAKRQKAIAKQEAKEAARRAGKAQQAEEERKLGVMLARDFPNVSADDAYKLWGIATILTDQIIRQYVHGERTLQADTQTWEILFRRRELNYLSVLEQMARQYKDLGQSFCLYEIDLYELEGQEVGWLSLSPELRIKVVCTAPLPD